MINLILFETSEDERKFCNADVRNHLCSKTYTLMNSFIVCRGVFGSLVSRASRCGELQEIGGMELAVDCVFV